MARVTPVVATNPSGKTDNDLSANVSIGVSISMNIIFTALTRQRYRRHFEAVSIGGGNQKPIL
jgi:hypothetical protein